MAPQPDTETFGFLLNDVARLIRSELDRRIGEAGLGVTPGEGRALVHAARAGEVRQNVLAERMGVEAMTLSSYLDRLETRGLIQRQPDPLDRRAKKVVLTAAAADVLAKIRSIAAAVRTDASQDIGDADWQKLQVLLRTVRDTLAAQRAGAPGEAA